MINTSVTWFPAQHSWWVEGFLLSLHFLTLYLWLVTTKKSDLQEKLPQELQLVIYLQPLWHKHWMYNGTCAKKWFISTCYWFSHESGMVQLSRVLCDLWRGTNKEWKSDVSMAGPSDFLSCCIEPGYISQLNQLPTVGTVSQPTV